MVIRVKYLTFEKQSVIILFQCVKSFNTNYQRAKTNMERCGQMSLCWKSLLILMGLSMLCGPTSADEGCGVFLASRTIDFEVELGDAECIAVARDALADAHFTINAGSGDGAAWAGKTVNGRRYTASIRCFKVSLDGSAHYNAMAMVAGPSPRGVATEARGAW